MKGETVSFIGSIKTDSVAGIDSNHAVDFCRMLIRKSD